MTIYTAYDNAVATGFVQDNPAQRAVLPVLQACYDALKKPHFFRWFFQKPKGIYLYGPVGSGKTFLMDIFYEALGDTPKQRMHLHAFIQSVDTALRLMQGIADPLTRIAEDLAKTSRVLCLDECMVTDRMHAMLLGTLIPFLLTRGVMLITTSNELPEQLYQGGFHREQFLPAIEAIEAHCRILTLDAGIDYRQINPPSLERYFWPLDSSARLAMTAQFEQLAGASMTPVTLFVQKRPITCLAIATKAIWFDFKVICALPRSALDYLELTSRFNTLFISEVPALSDKDAVGMLLLIRLIDIVYDAKVRLVLSAEVPLSALYSGIDMREAFHRIRSRLNEMQSVDLDQK